MAESKVAFLGGEPVVTEFAFDDTIMASGQLKVKTFSAYTEDWARFVYDNRENFPHAPLHDYDIIYGPIADLVDRVMEDYHLDLVQALDVVYSSEVFRKLSDPATGLYKEDPAYIYSYLRDELGRGTISPLSGA